MQYTARRDQARSLKYLYTDVSKSSTYGHSQLKTGHPVRSAIHKQLNGRLVLRWVTTWESLLLYVLHSFFCLSTRNQSSTPDPRFWITELSRSASGRRILGSMFLPILGCEHAVRFHLGSNENSSSFFLTLVLHSYWL
jgi:hypothetical protein